MEPKVPSYNISHTQTYSSSGFLWLRVERRVCLYWEKLTPALCNVDFAGAKPTHDFLSLYSPPQQDPTPSIPGIFAPSSIPITLINHHHHKDESITYGCEWNIISIEMRLICFTSSTRSHNQNFIFLWLDWCAYTFWFACESIIKITFNRMTWNLIIQTNPRIRWYPWTRYWVRGHRHSHKVLVGHWSFGF